MPVTIGVSMALFPAELPLDGKLAAIAAAGFAQAELPSAESFWRMDPAQARDAFARYGVRPRSAHSLDAGWDNDAPDPATRRASVDKVSSVFAVAAAIGVEVIVVHPNARYTHEFFESDYEASIVRSVGSLKELSLRAAAHGLKLAVENVPRRGAPRPGGTLAEILAMIDGLGPHVGVCVDVGHSNANGCSAAEDLRAAAGRVFAVHLQDNDGKGDDQHRLPGEGTIDWPAVAAALERYAPGASINFEIGPSAGAAAEVLATLARFRDRFFTLSPGRG